MTLIAAFRTNEGVVMCSDSMESTQSGFYVNVNKIKPARFADYQLLIGGAGADGPLIDTFVDTMRDQVKQWPTGLDEIKLKSRTKRILKDFYKNVVGSKGKSDGTVFLICLRRATDGAVFLWRAEWPNFSEVDELELVGFEEEFYKQQAVRLFRAGASSLRCMLLGIYILKLADTTNQFVGGPTHIAGITHTGSWPEVNVRTWERLQQMAWKLSQATTRELEERIAKFTELTTSLLLDCADTNISSLDFAEQLERLQADLSGLHREYTQRANKEALINQRNLRFAPYRTCAAEGVPMDDEMRAALAPEGEMGVLIEIEWPALSDEW